MKNALRSEMKLKREALGIERRNIMSKSISRKFRDLDEYWDFKTALVYISFDSEVETWDLIADLLDDKKRVAVPVLAQDKCEIFAVEIKKFEPEKMQKNRFGILEPKNKNNVIALEDIQMVIAPGLAFDESGARIGFGRGCYDKFLEVLPKGVPVVALAFDFQVMPAGKIPKEGHDKEVDAVITEMRVIRCK
ncbi:MAG: 5-formyltetrahydrofolate cyclo-ligase [Candidatus Diapherotrites archaeon]|nr:5-formyltetrahydrofolate cyclo-ligase [Candidatus Micrarchaeota archaeon]